MKYRHFVRNFRPHPTRFGFRAELPEDEEEGLRAAVAEHLGEISQQSYRDLVAAICAAKAERKAYLAANQTRKASLGQLKAMRKLPDDASLIMALRTVDQRTFNLIDQAQTDLICEVLREHGAFVDGEGNEWITPPSIQQSGPRDLVDLYVPEETLHELVQCGLIEDLIAHAYLPAGTSGLRASIELAIARQEEESGEAGAPEREYSRALALACVRTWRKYRVDDKAWVWDAHQSAIVGFVRMVFEKANNALSASQIAGLCRNAQSVAHRDTRGAQGV